MDAFLFDEYIKKIKELAIKHFDRIKEDNEMSFLEVKLLMQLYKNSKENLNASYLADKNRVTIAAIMHKMQSLEEKGYVYKVTSTEDTRTKYYQLTEKAIDLANQYQRKLENYTNRFFEYLGEKDAKVLEEILKKIIDFMEESTND